MIIYGASGHGKVVSTAIENEVVLFFDDNPFIKNFMDKKVLPYDENMHPNLALIVAIGNNVIRKKVVEKVKHTFGIIEHSSALVDHSVLIGEGSQVLHRAVIQVDTKIGKHTIVNTSASIDHDCQIGDFCHIAPNATLCGNVSVGEGSFVGAGSSVIPGVKIGKWAIIGAGSVILKDVPDNAVVVGNPGRML